MELEHAREALLQACARASQRALLAAYEGNLSLRLDASASGAATAAHVLITPARRCKDELEARDLVVLDSLGGVQAGGLASSESPLHLGIYQLMPDVKAVVHAHPPHSTAFACTRAGLQPLLQPEVLQLLGGPVPLAEYAPPGSQALLHSVAPLLRQCPVVLMARHGLVAISRHSVMDAVHLVDQVEQVARVTWMARQLDCLPPLSADEVKQILSIRAGI